MDMIGEPFIEIASTESTNALAMREAVAGSAVPGTAWFAHEQTAGKGQRGRVWQSEPGSSLAMSILLEPPTSDPTKGFPLSVASALSGVDALLEFGLPEPAVKWPNDLYHRGCKLGGILIENVVRGARWTHAVVGIGINVNQTGFDDSLPNPVSLLQVTGRRESPVALARTFCRRLEERLAVLAGEGPAPLMEDYNRLLHGRGCRIRFGKGGREFTAIPESVMEDGSLVLSGPFRTAFRHGEVDWLGEA